MASKKLYLDKYYTPQSIADYCTHRVIEVIGIENITELVESSAGKGVFLNSFDKFVPNIPCRAYDIEPEDDRIVKQDFLKLDLEYKKGRCVIGNPPFGFMTKLIIQFYKKSIIMGDYIAFIMPISFKDNTKQVGDFNLLASEDLGLQQYSDRKIHCCFNIYKKPTNGLNSQIKNKPIKLKDVKITEIRLGNKKCLNYDIAICSWGSIGKLVDNPNTKQFAKEFYIKINNDKYKDKITQLLKDVKWQEIYPMTNTPNLLQWQVYKYLKEQIPELE